MTATIAVFLQHRDGQIHRQSWEALQLGQALVASGVGEKVIAWLAGSSVGLLAEEVAGSGLVDRVVLVEHSLLAQYTPGGYRKAGLAAAQSTVPTVLLLPHTYQSIEFAPRLAWDLGAAWLPEAVGFEIESGAASWRRPVLGGKLLARVSVRTGSPVVVTVQAGVMAAELGRGSGNASIERLGIDLNAEECEREILGVQQATAQEVDLGAAEVIVGVGRGVGGADKLDTIRELAGLLGAELGASRPAVDSGWLPRDRQIGSSGQTVAPRLYVGLGISGAIQHLVGMKGSRFIVAINKDPGAPIFKVAHLGLVGDLHEILPIVVRKLRAAREGSASS